VSRPQWALTDEILWTLCELTRDTARGGLRADLARVSFLSLDRSGEFRGSLAAHACAGLLALLQASCTLVGYDARPVLSDAGTDGTEPLEPVVIPDVDASHLQVGAPDAGVSSDAGASTPLDSAAPIDPLTPLDSAVPIDPVAVLDAGEVAPSIPFEDQDAGATLIPRDAAVGSLTDAAAGSPSDADASSGDAGALAPCSGARALGLCWYLGSQRGSCNSACSAHGGVDVRAASLVGTTSQGGSLNSCAHILPALGVATNPLRAFRTDSYGLGCHVWSTGETYWLDDPSPLYSPSVVAPRNARMACGCAR
jgi:hypothetical protein